MLAAGRIRLRHGERPRQHLGFDTTLFSARQRPDSLRVMPDLLLQGRRRIAVVVDLGLETDGRVPSTEGQHLPRQPDVILSHRIFTLHPDVLHMCGEALAQYRQPVVPNPAHLVKRVDQFARRKRPHPARHLILERLPYAVPPQHRAVGTGNVRLFHEVRLVSRTAGDGPEVEHFDRARIQLEHLGKEVSRTNDAAGLRRASRGRTGAYQDLLPRPQRSERCLAGHLQLHAGVAADDPTHHRAPHSELSHGGHFVVDHAGHGEFGLAGG